MLLPRENVLDVLQCVDFATLLALQRSGSAFYDVIYRNPSILPRLRVFDFYLDLATGQHRLQEIVEDSRSLVLSSPTNIPRTGEFDYSMLQSFAGTVGTNFINSAIIASSLGPRMSRKFDMENAVEALPALKHVRKLSLDLRCLMNTATSVDTKTIEELMLSPLDNLQYLELDNVSNRPDWRFLRKEWALRLRSLSLKAFVFYEEPEAYETFAETFAASVDVFPKIDATSQAEILEYCTDFVHLPKGQSKKLTIKGWRISPKFLRRIVKAVAECKNSLMVVIKGPADFGVTGNHPDYARATLRRVGVLRYSALDGSHRVFLHPAGGYSTTDVTNNPSVTWRDMFKRDSERF